jgi:formylglycine-generating enzyme required for sulfatase activity
MDPTEPTFTPVQPPDQQSQTLTALRAAAALELLPGWHSVAEARGLHPLGQLVSDLFTRSWESVVADARKANNPTVGVSPKSEPVLWAKKSVCCIKGLDMMFIPPGRFLMGSPPEEAGRDDDEGPQHQVNVEAFLMSRNPITQAQWRAVAQWEGKEFEEELNPDPVAGLPERFRGDGKPVVNVSWNEAMAFCRRLQLRTGKHYTLPSEAQWEYACRAGTTTPFHFGETLSSELANYNATATYGNGPKGEHRQETTPVGMFPANAWGLQDMHGNVWEWCLDHWHDSYEGAPTDGRAWVEEEGLDGEQSGKERLLRGGSWFARPQFCRSAFRFRFPPVSRSKYWGFRVCCPV